MTNLKKHSKESAGEHHTNDFPLEGWWTTKLGQGQFKTPALLIIENAKLRLDGDRVAELGSLSSGAKRAMKVVVKRVFTIFATNASFLRVIANLQIQLSKICNIYHIIVNFLPKKHCF